MALESPDDALRRLLSDGRRRAERVSPDQVRLWDALTDAAAGGKRFRPALVEAAHGALGGRRPDVAEQVGAAVELLHTAFVIHDDVIDGDEVRRGRLNVSGTFRALAAEEGTAPGDAVEVGLAAGILAGDLALTTALKAVATCGAPRAVVERLLDLFDDALHTTAAGELLDVRLAALPHPVELDASLVMAEQKTSVYSFVLPLQAGAILAEAHAPTLDRLGAAGRRLGLAFQLHDDLLGVFGDPALTGKSATNDLRSRKRTPLIAHAQTSTQWPRLRPLLGRDLTVDELDEARALLTAAGSRRFVEELARSLRDDACADLAALGLPETLLSLVAAPPTVLLDGSGAAA